MTRARNRLRIVSLLIALCMIVGCMPLLDTPADAKIILDNAAAATPEQLASTEDLFASSDDGGMLRVIDGELWVWGSNERYSLGLNKDEAGNNATTSTKITAPMKHDFDFGTKDNGEKVKIVKIITSTSGGVTVLTDTDEIYSWGTYVSNYVAAARASTGGRIPFKWNTSALQGSIEEIHSSTLMISVKDSLGNWYVAGNESASERNGLTVHTASDGEFRPISENFVDKLQPSYDPEQLTEEAQQKVDANPAEGEEPAEGQEIYVPTTSDHVLNPDEQVGGSARVTIDRIIPSYGGCNSFIKTSDGALWSSGTSDSHQQTLQGPVLSGKEGANLLKISDAEAVPANKEMFAAGVDLDTLVTNGSLTAMIDKDGSVWMAGRTNSNVDFYGIGLTWATRAQAGTPRKVYDGYTNGAKCVKVFLSDAMVVFLTEDNSLYAIGQNANQFISTELEETDVVSHYTQVFTELSHNQTITGVYANSKGIMVVTKSGEQFWAGDNSAGTSGNGSTENPPPGEIQQSVPSTIPPVEPNTANEVIFELETEAQSTEGKVTYRYRAVEQYNETNGAYTGRTIMRYDSPTDTVGAIADGGSGVGHVDPLFLSAGQTFKLNVYFNDFGKLNQFVLPIRFNPEVVRVANALGVEWPSGTVVTPGAIGGATGINKCFTDDTWAGGVLNGTSGSAGTYPKIDNKTGWVSVAGYTLTNSAAIIGEQKMFSINFTVVGSQSAQKLFDIATQTNKNEFVPNDKMGGLAGYDESSEGDDGFDFGPAWFVSNTSTSKPGKFALNYKPTLEHDPFVAFQTKLVQLDRLDDMTMIRSDDSAVEAGSKITIDQPAGSEHSTKDYNGFAISYNNTDEVYTLLSHANPTDASYPQVDWEMELVDSSDRTSDGTTDMTKAESYLTVVEKGDTYLKFKVNAGLSETIKACIRVTATTRREASNGQYATKTAQVLLRSFEAPVSLDIVQQTGTNTYTSVKNKTVTFHWSKANKPTGKEDENRIFYVDFPENGIDFENTAVTWKLLDKDRNAISLTDTTNAVVQDGTIAAPGKVSADKASYMGRITIDPQHTTFKDDFVILRVESAIDPSKCAEVKIQTHLYVTDLNFGTKTLVRMPTGTTKDFSTLLQVEPAGDYYESNLVWSYVPSVGDGTYYISKSGSGANSASFSAGSTPTPTEGTPKYEKVKVTDTISGLEKTIDVQVLELDTPIKPEDITAFNVVGDAGDYITVSGLKAGDTITFYRTFDTEDTAESPAAAADKKVFTKISAAVLVNGDTYSFPVAGMMDSTGGTMGMTVTRAAADDPNYTYDRVPVDYDHEPSKVYGYVKLDGKADNNNAGVAVQLNGISNPEVVYTNEKGYFEFKTYVAPGTYTLNLSKANYLSRQLRADASSGYAGLVIISKEAFAISTEENPLMLYPGDLDANNAINTSDIGQYVRNWVGQSNPNVADFDKYDFYDSGTKTISQSDLYKVLQHNGWVRESYSNWTVPAQ